MFFSIASPWYLLFLLGALLLYYLFPHKIGKFECGKFKWVVLLLVSVTFYCLVGLWWTFVYVLGASLCTWFVGKGLQHPKFSKHKKLLLFVGIFIDFAILVVLKYTNFILGIVSTFTKSEITVDFIASLGISFYTLQIVGYLIDCYREMFIPEKNYLKFLLFSCYFPQMVSGPISRASDLHNQFFVEHKFDWQNIRNGSIRIIFGLLKKLVIADNIGPFVKSFLNGNYVGFLPFMGMILFVFQLYNDFSGCMDIVLGSSQCFGITITENFDDPFKSKTLNEFWRRWHITLGAWARDYIMYPLMRTKIWQKMTVGCNKHLNKRIARLIPLHLATLCVWLYLGIWHGGGWNFIIQGLWFWGLMAFSDLLSPAFKKMTTKINTEKKYYIVFQEVRTIFLFAIGSLMFRASSLTNFGETFVNIFSPLNIVPGFSNLEKTIVEVFGNNDLGPNVFNLLIGILGISIFVILRKRKKCGSYADALLNFSIMPELLLLLVVITIILFAGCWGPGFNAGAFIYEGF